MRIYLVGFMSCGKSTMGKKLARKLKYEFLDTDLIFERQYQVKVKDFLLTHSEEDFREIEREIMQQTGDKENIIVATGGGCPCYKDNMEWLLENGKVIYIQLPAKALYQRLKNSKRERPLLSSEDPDLLEKIIKMLKEREPFYMKAHEILSL